MKRSKKLQVLLGVLLVMCVITFGVLKYEEHKEEIKNSDEVILELASEDVTALSWEYESNSLAFHKDDTWIYDNDEEFPVDEEAVEELLSQFEEFGVSFTIENVEDYAQYGLDDPECTINIETEDKTYEILLGDYSTMDSERYVSIGDGNVYLVQNDPLDYFDAVLSDMIDHDETPSFDNVKEIQFAGNENYSISYTEENTTTYSEDDVYFTEEDGTQLPLDKSNVNSYLSTISSLNPTDYVTYKATEDDLKTYGLDDPELDVTVNYTVEDEETEETSDETFVLHVSRDPDDAKKDISDEDEEITAYVRVGESKIIYKITSDQYKDLMAVSYDDLRHEEIIWADFEEVTQIDVSLEDTDYSITSKGKTGKRTYYYNEEELELDDFESALTSLKADSFTDESPTEKEEISLTVHLDNENDEEVSIDLYRYDGTFCLAVVDGESVALVEREQVVDLIEAVNGIVLN